MAHAKTVYPTPVDFGGRLLRWDIDMSSPRITFKVESPSNYDPTIFTDLVSHAAGLWNAPSSSYLSLEAANADEQSHITVEYHDSIPGQAFSAGFAIFDETDDDGKPIHCRIKIKITTSVVSLAKTTLHELGHCLGLGHSIVAESIMSYELDKNSYALDIDDVAALSRLYPADGSEPGLPPGCAIQSRIAKSDGRLWLLLPLLIFLRRRRSLSVS